VRCGAGPVTRAARIAILQYCNIAILQYNINIAILLPCVFDLLAKQCDKSVDLEEK
jgi:hypothetical protein